jgi:hypothetical protein
MYAMTLIYIGGIKSGVNIEYRCYRGRATAIFGGHIIVKLDNSLYLEA